MKTRYLFGLPFATVTLNSEEIEVLIDTGFNGALMLPLTIIKKLMLPSIGFTQYAMADGKISQAQVYEAEILWLEQKRKIAIVSSNSDFSLLGMELLSDAKTTIDPKKNIIKIE